LIGLLNEVIFFVTGSGILWHRRLCHSLVRSKIWRLWHLKAIAGFCAMYGCKIAAQEVSNK